VNRTATTIVIGKRLSFRIGIMNGGKHLQGEKKTGRTYSKMTGFSEDIAQNKAPATPQEGGRPVQHKVSVSKSGGARKTQDGREKNGPGEGRSDFGIAGTKDPLGLWNGLCVGMQL